jgi:hypothetical protein
MTDGRPCGRPDEHTPGHHKSIEAYERDKARYKSKPGFKESHDILTRQWKIDHRDRYRELDRYWHRRAYANNPAIRERVHERNVSDEGKASHARYDATPRGILNHEMKSIRWNAKQRGNR